MRQANKNHENGFFCLSFFSAPGSGGNQDMQDKYDVIIIGAGVSGNAIARELAKKKRRIAVIERASDVGEGTSKANSGIVHAGFDNHPGTLKARLNVEGNRRMEELAKKLDFSFQRNGSMVLCFHEEEIPKLQELLHRAEENGVPDCRILTGDEAREREPELSAEVVAALLAPTGGIVCPFELTIALAENAAVNGVRYFFDREVTGIRLCDRGYSVQTANRGRKADAEPEYFISPVVINAAGVYAAAIHNMVSAKRMSITPRKGEYLLMDRSVGSFVHHTIFQLPNEYGKGVLVTPTVHGNLLIGPTAYDIEDPEGVNTTVAGMCEVVQKARLSTPAIPAGRVITSFAGLRAHGNSGDFIIGEAEDAPGFIDVAGIESPGLSSAPAIGAYVAEIVNRIQPANDRTDYIARRKGIVHFAQESAEEQMRLIRQNPAYGQVVCRCETITEGEILDAIRRPLGARTMDGVKRRTRAGMGRCQAGFCTPHTAELLAREWKVPIEEITKKGGKSRLLMERAEEQREDGEE